MCMNEVLAMTLAVGTIVKRDNGGHFNLHC